MKPFLWISLSCLMAMRVIAIGSPANSLYTETVRENEGQETDIFLQAKQTFFSRKYEIAQISLRKYLEQYPSGHYRDEALYWLAQSLDRPSKEEKSLTNMVDVKLQAIDALDELISKHPSSPWLDDAREMRKGLIGQALLLADDHSRDAALLKLAKGEDPLTVKQNELEFLLQLEPVLALRASERLMENEKNLEFQKQILSLVALWFPEESLDLINRFADGHSNPSLRAEASRLKEYIEMELIPVDLNFFCYSAYTDDASVKSMLPENAIHPFKIPGDLKINQKNIEKAIQDVFQDKLKKIEFHKSIFSLQYRGIVFSISDKQTQILLENQINKHIRESIEGSNYSITLNKLRMGTRAGNLFPMIQTSYQVENYSISPYVEPLVKTEHSISGVLRVENKKDKKYLLQDYSIDADNDQLMVVRKGDELLLTLLVFVSDLESEELKSNRPVYHTSFNNIMGAKVRSTRDSWDGQELAEMQGFFDYGESEAMIPGKDGDWRLIGWLQSDIKSKQFIGRNAKLYNPKKKLVAEAEEIVVPADAPEKFEITRK